MFHSVHIDSRSMINRPNLLPPSSADGANKSSRNESVGKSDASSIGTGTARWMSALRDVPAARAAAISAARAELASGQLLTRAAAEETATALLHEAIPD
ncbi:MAG: hypothetical protein ACK5Q5_07320 [Planctomycetaceae bacterium]